MVPSTSAIMQALDKPQAAKLSYMYSYTALNWVLNSVLLLLLSWATPPAPGLLLLISTGALLMTVGARIKVEGPLLIKTGKRTENESQLGA